MKQLLFRNGDIFPTLGLWTWLSRKIEVYDAVLEAVRLGYRHIDCAYIYQNEVEIGKALKFCFATGMVTREELFITSKLWNSDHAPERVEAAIRKSLSDLQLEYLDLYLIHWPIAFKTGHEQAKDADDLLSLEEMPLEITWEAMEKVQELGLARHIGVSNFNIPKLKKLIDMAKVKPEVNQVELHPYFQQNELVQFCQENGILVTAFSPLGSRRLINEDDSIAKNDTILKIAEKHSCLPTEVILAWGMKRGTAVIPKSVNSTRIRDNYESIYVNLDEQDMMEIAKIDRNYRLAKGLYCVMPDGCYTLNSIWID
ncbi:MAG TPA: aldo/keto reductase [Paludibacter sp.]